MFLFKKMNHVFGRFFGDDSKIIENEVYLKEAPLIIMDGNLTLETMNEILRIAEESKIPVFFEPTDAAIAERPFKSTHSKAIKFITPNIHELYVIANLLNIPYTKSSGLEDIAKLTERVVNYVDNVIVTMGHQGILIGRKGFATDSFQQKVTNEKFGARHYPTKEITHLVNVSGAGDCFASGFICALVSGKSEEICISVGFAAAELALFSESAVPKSMFDPSHESWNVPAKYTTII
ncbi:uncharacterized protein LOC126889889 isoform X2 [Diabrotica virgifera virgifera]|uniref:Carbohydrate kinase PfkB domain-containing protein n=1 Tax=Diabrotica virgifera virgifera TaxID=50390 RepID=A0ABM5KWJ5_DIAVI|nr:uncharacterized protein LOC126889889 isoform X2 [Diabrotica virgifera virgifera]